MSWQMTALVKARFKGSVPLKFLALVLADYADPEGRSIKPSVDTLARVTALSERTVRRMMSELRSMGFLVPVNAGRGGSRPGPRGQAAGIAAEYLIGDSWLQDACPANLSGHAFNGNALTPDVACPDKAVADEYSMEPTNIPPTPAVPAGAGSSPWDQEQRASLDECLRVLRHRRESAFGSDDRIFRAGVPRELLELQWWQFKRTRGGTAEARTIEGWRREFRKTVRSNSMGLWERDRGLFIPTDEALQLQSERDAQDSHAPGSFGAGEQTGAKRAQVRAVS